MKFFYSTLKSISCVLSLLVVFSSLSIAQNSKTSKDPVMFKTGFVVTDENLEEFIANPDISQDELFDGHYYRLIHFYAIPDAAKKEQLRSQGIHLMDYIPAKAYFAAIEQNADLTSLRNYNVKSVIEIENIFKLNKNLVAAPYPAHAMRGSDRIELVVRAQQNLSTYRFRQMLALQGFEVLANYAINNSCVIEANISEIIDIVELPYVSYLEPVAPLPTPDDQEGRSLHRSSAINTAGSMGRKYNGDGISIALADDGEVGPHIDFTGRISNDDPDLNGAGGGHGDMTAGIAVGAGNLDPRNAGMANGAHIFIYSINGYDHVRGADTSQLGYTITSTSYSQGCNEYTNDTELGDQMIHDNPHLMHVFSAGNNANGNCGYGVTGYGNITGGFKQGKNVIATGNLNYLDGRVTSSSRGPSEDGRVKPDLCANGGSQISTAGNNNYQTGGGTSAACPGIAGTLAQLSHAYKDITGATEVPTALLKACLQNTAEDLGRPGPDFDFGYGRINALRALQILENNHYLSDSIDQNGTNTHTITVAPGTQELRVLIHWADPGGNPLALTSLVNDINMQLSESANTWDPWILDPTPTFSAITSNAVRGVDSLNNTEQVTLIAPAAGTYTVTIDGYNIASGPQKYWLVYETREADPVVTFPIGGEGFAPGTMETIRWDCAPDVGTFTVDYSTDNGTTWNLISNSVASDQLHYEWNVPSVQTGEAIVRVSRGVNSGQSNNTFSIVPIPQNLIVSWACVDSIGLSWDAVAGVAGYEVSMLGAKYMDSVAYSTTTEATIYNTNPLSTYWFSVRSIGPGDIRGERAVAIDKIPGVFNCPIAIDGAMIAVVDPEPFEVPECQNAPFDLTVEFINVGQNALDSVPVYYSVNGGTPVMEMFIGQVASQATAQYTFVNGPIITGVGNYEIETWIGLPNDGNIYNDSTSVTVTLIPSVYPGPWFIEDFESSSLCSDDADCEVTICPLQNGWVNQTNGDVDDIDWRVDNGGTPSSNNGPTGPSSNMDHNPGTSTGHYIYTEASAGCNFEEAHLLSPCIDLTGTSSPQLSFWYSMRGGAMGDLHVDLMVNGTWTLDIMPPFIGEQNQDWDEATVDLSTWVGEIVNIRFRGITGNNWQSDMALDDIKVYDVTSVPGLPEFEPQIALYPNPNDGFFNLNAYHINSDQMEVFIYDLQGRVVYSENAGRVNGDYRSTVDLSSFAKGIYQVEVRTSGKTFHEKLTIQ